MSKRRKRDIKSMTHAYHVLRRILDDLETLSEHNQYADPDLVLPELQVVEEVIEQELNSEMLGGENGN